MGEKTYLEAIREALAEELRRDERVFLLGEDIGAYGGAFKVTAGLQAEFGPRRVMDTPLSESAIVGAAIGAAYMGMRPVAEMQFIDFISCCFQMITNFAAKSRWRWGAGVPIVIRGPAGGGVGGGPFHSQNVEAYFYHTPGLKIVMPATARDAKGLLKAAIRDPDPVLFLEHKKLYRRVKEELPDGEEVLEVLGRAKVRREGTDLTILTYGACVHDALAVAETLAREDGAQVEVVDLRTLKPLDLDAILASVKKTSKALILHEDQLSGGLGGEISALVAQHAFEWLDAPLVRLAALDTPVPYAHPLEDAFLPGEPKILEACRNLLSY
jgi:2-oxoisovalerate dehydrogenase E1 component beta subunit